LSVVFFVVMCTARKPREPIPDARRVRRPEGRQSH